jgi:hypothetical protein
MKSPHIDDYEFGRIVIDGQLHTKDVIIFRDRVTGNWWRKEGHNLYPEDLETVLEAQPDILVVGQGAYGRMAIDSETREALKQANIKLIAQPTEEACQTYNRLQKEENVVAALHLTC